MKKNILLLPMVSILFLQCCATSRTMKTEITAVPAKDQKIGFEETVTSQKKHFISLAPYSELNVGNRTMFMLSVQNCGEEPIDINYDNISVIFQDSKGDPMKISVQSPDEFINDFQRESRLTELSFLRSVLLAIKGYLGGLSEQQSRQRSFSDYYLNNTAAVAPFDAGEKMKEFETMRSQNQQIIEALPDFAMIPHTIIPGDNCTGVIFCDTRQLNPTIKGNFKITISVDNEEHQFAFSRAISKRKNDEIK